MTISGKVQIYTGDGKGKTTAAIGLAIRALGAGLRVCFIQFMKSLSYSEHALLPGISDSLTLKTVGKPFFIAVEGTLSDAELSLLRDEVVVFPPGKPPEDYVELIRGGLLEAEMALKSGLYDLVVLDEIIVALHFGLLEQQHLLKLIDSRPASVELVLTGRGATEELLEKADLVSEMREIKHYYSKGVEARKGFDC
jgi:cob(I)alamin adenosyltransferase